MNFSDLSLGEKTLRGLNEAGFTHPTPIQNDVIPLALLGRDVFGCAQTGTGKTGSFVVPILERLQKGRSRARMPRVLVLAPTRELAYQVAESFHKLGIHHGLKTVVAIGGESMVLQEKALSVGVDVIIATPGRLLDLFERGKILLHALEILVIDEVDRMLDMGFVPDIEKIVKFLPAKRQTLLFSATVPDEIRRLSQRFLNNPAEITITAPSKAAGTVDQYCVRVQEKDKRHVLKVLFDQYDVQNAIIFCNRKKDIGALVLSLKREKYAVVALHGDMTQGSRTEALEDFKSGKAMFLVASDIAARGLDVENLPFVFNYDIPRLADEYIHRIGRTGRAGRLGKAFTFITDREGPARAAVEKLIGHPLSEITVSLGKVPAPETITSPTPGDVPPAAAIVAAEKPVRKQKPKPKGPVFVDSVVVQKPILQDIEKTVPVAALNPGVEGKKSPPPRSRPEPVHPVQGFGDRLPAFMNVYFPDLP